MQSLPRVDAHVHFYRYEPLEYGWIDDSMAAIREDFLPERAARALSGSGVAGLVAVQARQSVAESDFLIELARQSPCVWGVVGWVDLLSDAVSQELERLAPRLVGVRHIVQGEPDDAFVLRPDFERGIRALGAYDLAYDILVYPRHLPNVVRFVDRHPAQRFVLDHLAKPLIRERRLEPWASQIRELALRPNVLAKLSGLVTEADWKQWRPADLRPYLETALEAFGWERLMFGSDFPVCLVAARYDQVYRSVADFVSSLSASEQDAVLGGNAARFYRLEARAGAVPDQTSSEGRG